MYNELIHEKNICHKKGYTSCFTFDKYAIPLHMLYNMGYNEKGLGLKEQGIPQPIPLHSWLGPCRIGYKPKFGEANLPNEHDFLSKAHEPSSKDEIENNSTNNTISPQGADWLLYGIITIEPELPCELKLTYPNLLTLKYL